MATELTANMKEVNPKQYEEITGRIPMGRWGNPEDLQGLVVFLASDASAYISGAVVPVDGGFMVNSREFAETGKRKEDFSTRI